MVFKPEPMFKAVETVRKNDEAEVVVLSAAGRPFTQAEALRLSKAAQIIVICGRYEGIDERIWRQRRFRSGISSFRGVRLRLSLSLTL